MAPVELLLLHEGAIQAMRRSWERAAWIVAHVLAPWGFKGSPKELLEPTTGDFDALVDPARAWDEIVARAVAKNAGQ